MRPSPPPAGPIRGELRLDVVGGQASIRFVEEERSILVETVFVPAGGRQAE